MLASTKPGVSAFSPDGKLLAIVVSKNLVHLVEVTSGHEIASLESPTFQIPSGLVFTADGGQLGVVCSNGDMELWHLGSIRQQLAAMKLDWELPPLPVSEARTQPAVTVLGATNQTDATAWRRHFDRASSYERVGQYENAFAEYQKIVELRPDFASAYNFLAWAYIMAPEKFRSPEKALPLALKAVELSKTNHNELNTLGIVYYRLGEFTNAAATLEAGVKADKGGGIAHDFFFLAMAYQRLGDPLRAQHYFAKATNWMASPGKLSTGDKVQLEALRAETEQVLRK
jgi:tetratricopeptide (TPR) repeat protein